MYPSPKVSLIPMPFSCLFIEITCFVCTDRLNLKSLKYSLDRLVSNRCKRVLEDVKPASTTRTESMTSQKLISRDF